MIQQGISDKIGVNCRDSEGRTAVWWAAEKNHLQLLKYLQTQNADLNIADVSAKDVYLSVCNLTPFTYPNPTSKYLHNTNTSS